MEEVKRILRENIKDANCGIFFTRNIVGDYMTTLYSNGDIQIDICRGWAYFEVFGLSEEQEDEIYEYYESLLKEESEKEDD